MGFPFQLLIPLFCATERVSSRQSDFGIITTRRGTAHNGPGCTERCCSTDVAVSWVSRYGMLTIACRCTMRARTTCSLSWKPCWQFSRKWDGYHRPWNYLIAWGVHVCLCAWCRLCSLPGALMAMFGEDMRTRGAYWHREGILFCLPQRWIMQPRILGQVCDIGHSPMPCVPCRFEGLVVKRKSEVTQGQRP